ncbi:PTS sugar transporter subunit IIA [Bacillus marinisedimentorum]|uniref:PTS sugar transporter subunit IIA n=1 Tax=Bacillus marinisedimentorum TaxID=1821260 RepID=UPI0007E1D528|nr:PTS glucose transporter subunit IIA [Bacillus marinisedimentorum]
MGLLDKLFGGGNKEPAPTEETLVSPLSGEAVDITEVPDPTFSQKMMGDGVAIRPAGGQVVAPVDGEIIQLFHTKHAIGLRTRGGIEILIHIGLETVSMNGEGFTAHVSEGDKVKAGDLLIEFDMDLVIEKASSTITPIVLTNGDVIENVEKMLAADVQKGETPVMKVDLKQQ